MKALPTPSPRRGLEDVRLLILLIVVCAVGGVVIVSMFITHRAISRAHNIIEHTRTIPAYNAFASLDLEAQAVYVWDMKTQTVLYSYNADNVYPLASLTKIATALTATRLVPENVTVTLDEEAIAIQGDSGLRLNETWDIYELMDFTLVTSSNDGAYGIAAVGGALVDERSPERSAVETFVTAMNATAQDIGLTRTRFYNPTGLDVNTQQSGGYGSARDMALLVDYTLRTHPDILSATRLSAVQTQSLSGIAHDATNTNPFINSIPGVLASKTGYTDLAGGNLVIAYDPFPGRPIIISVLGSSFEGRFRDVTQLADAALLQLQRTAYDS